jgi:polysaccharide deacetylase 2 family uncharacterized protein YibQ
MFVFDTFYLKDKTSPTLERVVSKADTASEQDDENHSVSKVSISSEVKIPEKMDILTIATEVHDYTKSQAYEAKVKSTMIEESSCSAEHKVQQYVKKTFSDGMPRLAIIMDDIGTPKQIESFLKIPFTVTPSIFPATRTHPETPLFARELHHYMVHLPMEAFAFDNPEENTLKISDSLRTIEEKIANIVRDFPDVMVMNNHTGSKFTSNAKAMDRLFCTLDNYDISFVDSKTTAKSTAKKVAKLYNRVVLERNIFLDNEADVGYILEQIKQAVLYAKKHGEAIAICHPRPETFRAFKQAEALFSGVKLVYIDELY